MKKKILIAPLDWGLGHATRCIPIIRELIKQGCTPIIGGSGEGINLLEQTFDGILVLELPAYQVYYKARTSMTISMLLQAPKILRAIENEHKLLQQYVTEYNIAGVISDNRFGLSSDKVPSVFISHQIFMKAPIFEKAAQKLMHRYMKNFTSCWVPDVESENESLAGQLSHGKSTLQLSYIGPLSRVKSKATKTTQEILIIISGPEDYRTLFEKQVLSQLLELPYTGTVLLGQPQLPRKEQIGKFAILNHVDPQQFSELISRCSLVISRSGYSTIMDIAAVGKPAILIPTPQQPEQTYLAEYFARRDLIVTCSSDQLNLEKMIPLGLTKKGIPKIDNTLLTTTISNFISGLKH